MKSRIINIIFCIALIGLSSCIEELDFDQVEDIKLTPTYTVSLIYSNLPQTFLVSPTGVELEKVSDVTEINIFGNSTADRLTKIDLEFEITNPFDRRFTLDFKFLNGNSVETHTIPTIQVEENVSNFKVREEILLTQNSSILDSKKIEITLKLLPSTDGSIIDINDNKSFIFQSAGTFYFGMN